MTERSGAGTDAVETLLEPETIRARCHNVMQACEENTLRHFNFHADRLDPCADFVDKVIRSQYPDLNIPFHSRWRHLEPGGRPLLDELLSQQSGSQAVTTEARARIAFDLAIVSVLLDAGAGADWQYQSKIGGSTLRRSEGLAIASFDLFASGLFSADDDQPLRVDATALVHLTESALAQGFQVTPDNPLVGVAGRTNLLRGVGRAMQARPEIFGTTDPRIAGLYDWLVKRAENSTISASTILRGVLVGFGEAWPLGQAVAGVKVGDVWPHPHAGGSGVTAGFVPFHKLSQWLSYSLVEPLERAGFTISNINQLTGLPEYRNGGLFIDTGVLSLKNPDTVLNPLAPGHECIIEWRALTVALLDRIAIKLQKRYDRSAEELPLLRVLEGGTWAAGRKIAASLRDGGGPPIVLASDGTVF